MIGRCPAPDDATGLVRGLLDTVDCNIREGVQGGYAALFGPTSTLSAVITVLLTLYVALMGLRLLTGRTDLRVADLPMIAIKIGAVVLLTTSWASYQSLVFALLFDGPAELANGLLGAMPPPPGGGPADIFARLQTTFDGLTQSAAALAVTSDAGGAAGPDAADAGLQAGQFVLQAPAGVDPETLKGFSPIIQMRSALQGGPAFGATALWLSAVTLLVSTLGLLTLAKLMLGLLLAIGPLFVGMLLFETTKGFFEGWLRTALGFALVPLATIVFMAGLLASLEPSLAALAEARAEDRYDLEPVLTVLVIVLTFTAVFASVLSMCTRLVAGFRLPRREPVAERAIDLPDFRPAGDPRAADALMAGSGAGSEPSRAARLAASLTVPYAAGDRRDARIAAAAMGWGPGAETGDRRLDVRVSSDPGPGGERLGQAGRRRAAPRPGSTELRRTASGIASKRGSR